jgi:peptide-methionine (S)-S-oxide reductase
MGVIGAGLIAIMLHTFTWNGMMEKNDTTEKATFGAGCFWCVEAIFERVKGVQSVVSGYAGGEVNNPTYREVSSGRTGHAEVVQITFDPGLVSYTELLEIFFKTHDPTTLNRQGADVGTQYRSLILYHDDRQRQLAEKTIRELDDADIWKKPIVTRVEPFEAFYPAEDEHQEYFANNPEAGYCRMVIQPKVDKFEKVFKEKLKE